MPGALSDKDTWILLLPGVRVSCGATGSARPGLPTRESDAT